MLSLIILLVLIFIFNLIYSLMDSIFLWSQRSTNLPSNPWLSESCVLGGIQTFVIDSNMWTAFWILHLDFAPIIYSIIEGEKFILIIIILLLINFALYDYNHLTGSKEN